MDLIAKNEHADAHDVIWQLQMELNLIKQMIIPTPELKDSFRADIKRLVNEAYLKGAKTQLTLYKNGKANAQIISS